MTRDDSPRSGLSRRQYLVLAGSLTPTGILSGCQESQLGSQSGLDQRFERGRYWTGPASERPNDAPPGTEYYATDTGARFIATGQGWDREPLATPSLDADAIAGVADYVVTTTAELVAAFESLSDGDTVYVATGVYRPAEWLTIDANHVTVVGESRRGTLIKPEDGANVGGIHVGPVGSVENVRIEGVGFHGNADAMDQSVKRLHGFVVDDASAVTIQRCFATRTSPYHEHDDGGSGFTVRRQARDVALLDNYALDVGDRSIQVAGTDLLVAGNRLYDGWDRGINLEVRQPDGRKYFARNVSVVGNVGRNFSDGDFVGASQVGEYASEAGNYAIVGNVADGSHRHLVNVTIRDDTRNLTVAGNVGIQGETRGEWSGIRVGGKISGVTIVGNTVADYSTHGVNLESGVRDVTCTGNELVGPARDGVHVEASDAIVDGNVVRSAGETGVAVTGSSAVVSNNLVADAGADGVRLGPDASPAVVAANLVRQSGQGSAGNAAIRVAGTGALVGMNRVTGDGQGPTVREVEGADRNLYVGNLLPDGDAWRITGPQSRLFGNVPSPSTRRDVSPRNGTAEVEFARPYEHKPRFDVRTESPALWGVEWRRDDRGNYVGATLSLENANGEPVDPVTEVSVGPPRRTGL